MTTEASLPVVELMRWCSRADAEVLRSLLIGCGLDDGRADDLAMIVDANVGDRLLVLESGRRVPLRTVMPGAIVDSRPGGPLLAAWLASRTPADQREAAERAELVRRGVNPDRLPSTEARRDVLTFLVALDSPDAPQPELPLERFYEAMQLSADAATYRRAADALRGLATACDTSHVRQPETLPWRLAWFLCHSGQYDEAIAVSETTGARRMQGKNRAYMAGIRASALMSLATARNDPRLLDLAEQSIAMALAAGSDRDIVDQLYRTLRSARANLGGVHHRR
jgi:hypothetical protein